MALPDVISEELKSGEGRGKSELKEGEWGGMRVRYVGGVELRRL